MSPLHRIPTLCLLLAGCDLFFPQATPTPTPTPTESPTPTPAPTAVDEACGGRLATGDPDASDAQIDGLWRLNCHRAALGIPTVAMSPALNAAAQGHADYLVATGTFSHEQTDASHAAYTGQWAWDRAEAAGYVFDDGDTRISEEVGYVTPAADPIFAVDNWINTVYHRVAPTEPVIEAVGFGSAGTIDVLVVAAPYETPALASTRVPAPDQFGVPTTFRSDTETPDPVPGTDAVGFPISWSFNGPWTGPADDPLQLTVDAATSLTGPDGAVTFHTLQPSSDDLLSTAAFLVPAAPLTADTEYTVRFVVDVGGAQQDATWSFRTAP